MTGLAARSVPEVEASPCSDSEFPLGVGCRIRLGRRPCNQQQRSEQNARIWVAHGFDVPFEGLWVARALLRRHDAWRPLDACEPNIRHGVARGTVRVGGAFIGRNATEVGRSGCLTGRPSDGPAERSTLRPVPPLTSRVPSDHLRLGGGRYSAQSV